jgi:hypothetical protein
MYTHIHTNTNTHSIDYAPCSIDIAVQIANSHQPLRLLERTARAAHVWRLYGALDSRGERAHEQQRHRELPCVAASSPSHDHAM